MANLSRSVQRQHPRGNVLEDDFRLTPSLFDLGIRLLKLQRGLLDLCAAFFEVGRHAIE